MENSWVLCMFGCRLFDDVTPVLRHLKESGMLLYVYSSGSVEAQKLLFQYSVDGNLLEVGRSIILVHFSDQV